MKKKLHSTKILPVILLVCMLLVLVTPSANATAELTTDTSSGLPSRTGKEIAEQWKKLMSPTSDINKPYQVQPSVSKNHTPGSLKADYLKDAVNAANFYRFISGLPYDLKTSAELNEKAQYGSVLLAANKSLSHRPGQPSNMDDDFYKKGYASTSSANIYSSFGFRTHILIHSIHSYMEDSDVYNLDAVGHRRWILNPMLLNIGLGLAESTSGSKFSAMQVFDRSRTEKVAYNYVAYPAQGAFPIEVFNADYAWSISPNMSMYEIPDASKVTVTLTRTRDKQKKTWKLGEANNKVTSSDAYFNVDETNYGSGPAIIFRPNGIDKYAAGDKFEVVVSGLLTLSGSPAKINYSVEFMSAQNYVAPPKPEEVYPFSDIATHWARDTIIWANNNKIVSGYADGKFKPKEQVSEEEFLKMFIGALAIPVPESDGRWSNKYYVYAGANGYNLLGSSDSAIRLLPMSRLSVAELIASAAGLSYTDDAAIQYLLDNGYSQGKSSATVEGYQGADTLTRAEAVQFLKNLLDAGYMKE